MKKLLKKAISTIAMAVFLFQVSIGLPILVPTLSLWQVSANSVQTINIPLVKDAIFTSSDVFINNRHSLPIGRYTWQDAGTFHNSKALMQFALENIPNNAIVTSAKLIVYQFDVQVWGNTNVEVRRAQQNWSEFNGAWSSDFNFLTAPYATKVFTPFVTNGSSAQPVAIDLPASLINDLLATGNPGIGLMANAPDSNGLVICAGTWAPQYANVNLCNWNNYKPKLEVSYIINQPPYTSENILPGQNATFSGNCNESVIPTTGICRSTLPIHFQSNGVGDGDTAPGHLKSTNFNIQNETTGGYINSGEVGYEVSGTVTWDYGIGDGYQKWRANSVDHLDMWGQASDFTWFTVDTTPPEIPVLDTLPEYTAGVGIDSTSQIEPTGQFTTDNITPQNAIKYILQYSSTEDFSSNVFTKPDQVFTDTTPRFELGPKGIDEIVGTPDDIIDGVKYFIRVKAKDFLGNTSNWSNTVFTTIDGTKPFVSDLETSEERISPVNADGTKDSVSFNFKVTEANTKNIKLEVRNSNGDLVKEIIETLPSLTTYDSELKTLDWDGTDNSGNPLPDGAYEVTAIATDVANNIPEDAPIAIVIVDNTAANILFNQTDNFWTNQSDFHLTGQVTMPHEDGKEDKDIGQFTIYNFEFSNWEDAISVTGMDYDLSTGIFDLNKTLNSGANQFKFRTIDLTGNAKEFTRNINLENTAPSISNISPSGLINTRNFNITFSAQDFGGSDLEVGTNPSNVKLSLDLQTWNNDSESYETRTVEFVNDGIILDNALVTGFTCTPQSGAVTSTKNGKSSADKVDCSVSISNIQPDSDYTIKLDVKDNAGNTSQSTQTFTLDSNIFLELDKPVDGGIYATSSTPLNGRASKGSQITIENISLGQSRTFTLDESLNGTGADSFILENFSVTCGEFEDVDGRSDTPDEEVCNFSTKILAKYVSADLDTLNSVKVSVQDGAGNTLENTKNVIVNLYKFDLSISSDLNYFSPNGDGKQDTLKFFHQVSNQSDPLNPPVISSYLVQIKDSLGNVIREMGDANALPPFTFFDGTNSFGEVLVDGVYTYTLSVTTFDGVTLTTTPKAFYVKTELTNEVVITNPVEGMVTTNGVITVQGQAPVGTTVDPASSPVSLPEAPDTTLKGAVKVFICIDTLVPDALLDPDTGDILPGQPNDGQGNNVECDQWQEVEVDENGFFTTVVILPDITGLDQSEHSIKAYAFDEYGNATPYSNIVTVTLDIVNPFNDVSIIPTLTGVTSAEDYERFLNGEIDISQIRALKFRANVSENTEQVELSFADFTSLPERPESPAYSHIATLTNEVETSPLLNPFGNLAEKKNQGKLLGDPIISQNNCSDSAGCTWEYTMPLNEDFGGIYEVNFKGLKGSVIQEMTRGFKVDGRIPPAPVFMVIEKWDEAIGVWVQMEGLNVENFTDTGLIRFRGAAEPGTLIELWDTDGNKFASLVVSDTGVWEFVVDLEEHLPTGGGPGGGTGGGGGTPCTGLDCLTGSFGFLLKGYKLDEFGNPIPTSEVVSDENITVNYDQRAPEITDIVRTTPVNTVNGWVKTGDQASFTITADEPLLYSDILKQDGFVRVLTNLSNQTLWGGTINVDRPEEGYYRPELRVVDMAENRNEFDTTEQPNLILMIDNTKPDVSQFDTSEYSSTWEEGGINADGITLEQGRTNPGYVTQNDIVILKGKAERNQRVEIYVNNELVQTVNVSNNNCTADEVNKVTADGLITKYGEKCDWQYVYEFLDNGENTWEGVPINGYVIQARVVDSAYNVSEWNEQMLVYHDHSSPLPPELMNISSASYGNTVPGLGEIPNGVTKGPITKDIEVLFTHSSERFSDIEFWTFDADNTQIGYWKYINGSDRKTEDWARLGLQGDDREGCVQKIGSKRTGVCQDGNYSVGVKNTDAAGNFTGMSIFGIERDTVAPEKPGVNVYQTSAYTIGTSITGEQYAVSALGNLGEQGFASAQVRTLDPNNPNDWTDEFTTRYHTVCSSLTDRALNQSGLQCGSVKLPVRPIQGNECEVGIGNYAKANPESDYVKCSLSQICDDTKLGNAASSVVSSLNYSCRYYAGEELKNLLKSGLVEKQKEVSFSTCIENISKYSYGSTDSNSLKNQYLLNCSPAEGLDEEFINKILDGGVFAQFNQCLEVNDHTPGSKIELNNVPEGCKKFIEGISQDKVDKFLAQNNWSSNTFSCLDGQSKNSDGKATMDQFADCVPEDVGDVLGMYTDEQKENMLKNYNFSSCLNTNFEAYCVGAAGDAAGCRSVTDAANELYSHCKSASGIEFEKPEDEVATKDSLSKNYQDYKDGLGRGNYENCGFLGLGCLGETIQDAWYWTKKGISFSITVLISPYTIMQSSLEALAGLGGSGDPFENLFNNVKNNLQATFERVDSVVQVVGGIVEGVVSGVADMAKSLIELPMQAGMYLGGIIDGALNGKSWDQISEGVEQAKEDFKNATGWDLGSFGEDLGNFIMAVFTIATFGAGSVATVAGRSLAMTVLKTVVAPALLETGIEAISETIKGNGMDGAGLALSLALNLLPGAFDIDIPTNKILNKVFKGADEIVDGAGNVIKKVEFEKFLKFKEFAIDDVDWGKFKNVLDNFSGNFDNLSAKELDRIAEITNLGKKIDEAFIKGIELPTGGKFSDYTSDQLDNIIGSQKTFGEVNVKNLEEAYGKEIFNDTDELDDALGHGIPATCILGQGVNPIDLLIPKVSAAGCIKPWRQAEIDAQIDGYVVPTARDQVSFQKIGDSIIEVPYGTKGSVRPDYWDDVTKVSFEVKKYDLNKNFNNLVEVLNTQYARRLDNLPSGATQKIVLDVRNQTLSKSIDDIINAIAEETPFIKENIIIME